MIPIQTLVRHIPTGKIGVVVSDFMACCTDSEVPVVFDGTNSFAGTLEGDLKVLGPEQAIPDFKRCGGGQGARCCRFLVAGARGLECERFGHLRYMLIFKRDMTAQRDPTALYPSCLLPREEGEA